MLEVAEIVGRSEVGAPFPLFGRDGAIAGERGGEGVADIAAESRAYGPVAAAAFAAQSTLVSAFGTLMAVPIVPCGAPKQP